ncbi:hypothetical protein [Nocardia sp. BMG51109]|uniref:hypothetical protein n=1 Tax=Nocardia sp. BMG51109 TaxID=1056816 RepID=UPI00046317F6|nr:hypothetical protein [Nocardia sp. BMG51109]
MLAAADDDLGRLPGIAHLYRFVTERPGPLEAVTDIEITPALRVFKQAQALLHADHVTLVP